MMETSKVLGEEHPATLISINNLAMTYWNQGREEHPNTLISMKNLAHTWEGQGRTTEAISIMERCFQLRKQVLGPRHPRTEASLKTLHEWEDMAVIIMLA